MADYNKFSFRFVNIGLNLRDAPDKVGEGQWVRLNNIRSTQEAQIQPREGSEQFGNTGVASPIHTLRRLSDTTLLVGVADQLFRNNTPYGTAGYSGNPLSIVSYRPSISSSSWAYIGDSNQMRKVSPSGQDFKWGITAPTVPAVFVAGAAGNLDSSVSGGTVYDWRYTYYSSVTGAESNPSDTVNGIAAVNQQVTVTVAASLDPQVDQIRIYRRGGTLSDWLLSLTVANASGGYIDNNADSSIVTNEVLHLDRFVPFTSIDASGAATYETPMPYVWGPFIGKYIMACGAPFEPGFVFWTNSQQPDEAAIENKVEVTPPQEPLQNGFIYASNPFVFSKNDLYALDFGNAASVTFNPRKTPCGKGLAAPWSFCVGPLIWFLSDDGIYQTDGNSPATSITEEALRPMFRGIAVSDFLPVDYSQDSTLRLAYSQNEVHFYYKDTGGTQHELIYNTLYQRWRSAKSALTDFVMGYGDENVNQTRYLIGGSDGKVYRQDPTIYPDVTTNYPVNVRTGSVDMGAPTTYKEYGNVIIDADLGGNLITVTPYINTEQSSLSSFILSGSGRQKYTASLQNTRAYNIAFDFEWFTDQPAFAGTIYQMDVLWRLEEESIRHWQMITTHGLQGWQHVQDAYFSLISNQDVTFTLTIDDVDYTYTIPSTNGLRKKQYIQLQAVKGKVFKYTLDCDTDFRLFGNECEVRVKQWVTDRGYQVTSPFQDDVEA